MTKIVKMWDTYALKKYLVAELEDGRIVQFAKLPARKVRESDFTPYENTEGEELMPMKIHKSVFYLDNENYDLWQIKAAQ